VLAFFDESYVFWGYWPQRKPMRKTIRNIVKISPTIVHRTIFAPKKKIRSAKMTSPAVRYIPVTRMTLQFMSTILMTKNIALPAVYRASFPLKTNALSTINTFSKKLKFNIPIFSPFLLGKLFNLFTRFSLMFIPHKTY